MPESKQTVLVTVPAFVLRVDVDTWATEYGIPATPEAVVRDAQSYYTPGDMIEGSPLAQGENPAVRVVADAADVVFGTDCVSKIIQPDPLDDLKLVCGVCRDHRGEPMEICSVEVADSLGTLTEAWLLHAAHAAAAREQAKERTGE